MCMGFIELKCAWNDSQLVVVLDKLALKFDHIVTGNTLFSVI